eukprot:TRINITY_DN201_c0_g1_i1.p1 TRINITY_DN201_c0_g1~~TRINITY_DN201_c0_g1_i1.p1  ORF type:complete len:366 (+),score=56.45 TRINITY_DN201_c0_g1_i1:61-1158(+)
MQLNCASVLAALVALSSVADSAKSRSSKSILNGRHALGLEQVLVSHPQQALMSLLRSSADASAPDPSISSLAAIAASLSQDASTTPSSVQQIKSLVLGLEDGLIAEFNTTQSGINNISGFQHCIDTMNSAISTCNNAGTGNNSAYEACIAEWRQLNDYYTTCRATEQEYNATRVLICNDYSNASWQSPFNWHFCPANDNFQGTYEQYLQRSVDRLYTLRSLRENCTRATDRWTNKTDMCDATEIVLNEKWENCSQLLNVSNCTGYNCRKTSCTSYDTCWSAQEGAFNATVTMAYGLEKSLHAQWRALQRIECLLEVIDASSNQTAMLEECIARRHVVPSYLNFTNTAPPAKPPCSSAPRPDACPA